MRIFHIATVADWAAARESGAYTTSTRGVSLEDEGFIHASRADQWRGVHARYYADADEPLLLLEIDTDRLAARVVEEPVGQDTYPHVYGPITPTSVLRAVPLEQALAATSFSAIFLREVMRNALLGLLLLVLVSAGALLLDDDGWGALIGAALGLAVGIAGLVVAGRLRR